MQNIEIKTPLPDPADVEARARAAGAAFQWSRRQRDVFFRVPEGYLKLRTAPDGPAELIAYARAAGTDPRPSDYDIAPVADPAAMEAVLSRSLGVRGVVEKVRRLYLWRHTRIHLDEVIGLGSFMELETVVLGISREEAEVEAREMIAILGLDPARFLDRPYLELLEREAR
jgi:predicted adenylyl cyclase CyaB